MNDCEVVRPYTSGATLLYEGASTTLRPHQPSPISLAGSYSPVPLPSAGVSPKQDLNSPPAQMIFKMEDSPAPIMHGLSVSRDSSEAPKKSVAKGAVATKDEPYAKLIERALRSRPDYSMQLQEIYQWFLENTDKARTFQSQTIKESKGWQNSIRHNLSMNAVS